MKADVVTGDLEYTGSGARNLTMTPAGELRVTGGSKSVYTLLDEASATGPQVGPVNGGDYYVTVEGNFGGATATLQRLGLDGSTWKTVYEADGTTPVSFSTEGSTPIGIAQGAVMRMAISGGTGVSLSANLAGL